MHPPSTASPRRSSTIPRQSRGSEDWQPEEELEEEPKKSKKSKKRKKKADLGPLWARLLLIFGALLMVISGGVIITTKVLLDKATSSVGTVDIVTNDSMVSSGKALEGVLNILLVGIDDGQAGTIDNRTDLARADSIMILHVPAKHDHGYIVSVPRDSWVKIPKYPKTGFGGGSAKINAAYSYGFGDPKKPGYPGRAGGLDLLMQTLNKETGITFNAAATVNFTGFTTAVKMLGGVTMYIDERVKSVHYGSDKNNGPCVPAIFDGNAIAHPVGSACKPKVYEKGTRRLTPDEALDYTRQREWMELDDGDYGRQRHQQQFIKALVREAKAQGLTTNLPKALSLISSVGSTLTMWTNGVKLEDWFFTLKDVAGSDISMIKTNGGTYNSADVTGTSAEALSDLTKQMFIALRENRIDGWLLQHPDWLGSDSVG